MSLLARFDARVLRVAALGLKSWCLAALDTDTAARHGDRPRRPLAGLRPRRPTLMVADPMPRASLQAQVQALVAIAAQFAHPVRVLAAVPSAELDAWLAAPWDGLTPQSLHAALARPVP